MTKMFRRLPRRPSLDDGYHPTKWDMEYRNSVRTNDPFDRAWLLKHISHEYLAVLAQDNAGPTSAGTKAMIDAEISRRGFVAARNANRIAIGSLAVSIIALVVSAFH